jgi:hypothetical protein
MISAENIINIQNPSNEDLDHVIAGVREDIVPGLKDCDMPLHCGVCSLYKFCKIINHLLICPWIETQ